ncbi:MAG: proteasome accessory factor, partial [Pseudonocardiales bacterium]|nr:proteasome accessory factor [Pseudonocardiales bacterium]
RPGDELELDLRNVDTVARWLAGHGPDVAVLGPESLAAAVRANWAAAAAAHAPHEVVAAGRFPVSDDHVVVRPDRAGTGP